MEDASHVIVYRRFFGVLLAVLPGLVLCYIACGITMLIVGDAIGANFGWAIGFGALLFMLVLIAWIFIGSMLEKWTEEKSAGFLAGVAAPFIFVLMGGFCGMFLWVENIRDCRHQCDEHATEDTSRRESCRASCAAL
jgi:hypothetical protein